MVFSEARKNEVSIFFLKYYIARLARVHRHVVPEAKELEGARDGPFGRKFFAIEISASLNFRKNLRPKELSLAR